MLSLDNIKRIQYKTEDVTKLIKLYQYKGKEFFYANALKEDSNYIKKEIVGKDTFYFSKILNLNVRENRIKHIIVKNSKPKNKDEVMVTNIKAVLEIASNMGHEFDLVTNEVSELAKRLFADIKRVSLVKKEDESPNELSSDFADLSARNRLDHLFNTYHDLLISEEYEIVNLVTNFYVDFINLKPFNDENDTIGLLLIYLLLIREHFDIVWYQSFFEFIYNNFAEFESLKKESSYNWKEGFSRTENLTNLIIRGLILNYKNIEQFIRNYQFDNKLNKGDNIEATIYKINQTFTKEEIRAHHPYVSESTINRTLQRLRDEGKISPLGTGRSAAWIRVVEGPEKFNAETTLDIFGVGDVDDNDED